MTIEEADNEFLQISCQGKDMSEMTVVGLGHIRTILKRIYQDFENKSCNNCGFDYRCSIQDSIIQGHESTGLDISKDFIINPFYCNRYEAKEIK